MTIAVAFALLLLIGVLTLVSYVDRVYQELGKFLSREFQDNIDVFEQKIEPKLRVSRGRASLSMAVLTQLTMATVTLLIGFLLFSDQFWGVYEVLQAAISLLLIVIVFQRFLPFVFFSRTKGEWLSHWTLFLRLLIYVVMPVTIVLGFLQSVASLTKENTREEPETSAEAVDALIEAGQEEGIIQAGDRDLLREMQKDNIRMAIVVDEYGGVAGLVTIEDLVEEIVGEIRDDRDKPEVVREGERVFVVAGGMDVDRLDELFGIKPEGKESATIAGLVSELAGRIPHKGEVVEEDGLRFEVLEATDRKVERVRVTTVQPRPLKI